MIVYKVTTSRGYSLMVRGKEVRLHYAIGKTTKPKAGAILAFDTLSRAECFASGATFNRIFKCEAQLTKKKLVPRSPGYWGNFYGKGGLNVLRNFWNRGGKVSLNDPYLDWPSGTVFCASVTSTEEVR